MSEHTLLKHEICTQSGCCPICDGGLALCTVCGGAEDSMPTHCPGRKMMAIDADAIQRGHLDYIDGTWVRK